MEEEHTMSVLFYLGEEGRYLLLFAQGDGTEVKIPLWCNSDNDRLIY